MTKVDASHTSESPESIRVRDAIEVVAINIAHMIRDLETTTAKVPHSTWTAGETAAHVALAQRFFAELVEGAESPYLELSKFPELNSGFLSRFDDRNGSRLADLILEGTERFLEAAGAIPEDSEVNWHLGHKLKRRIFDGYVLYHLLAHSYDLAAALGLSNPLKPSHVHLTIPFLKAVAPIMFDSETGKGVNACIQLRIRGGSAFNMVIRNAVLVVEDPPVSKPDCYLLAEPVAFFLVAGGLIDQWNAIFRGKLFAWGRRPWLALRLKSLLPTP